jgi:hypothetical protein
LPCVKDREIKNLRGCDNKKVVLGRKKGYVWLESISWERCMPKHLILRENSHKKAGVLFFPEVKLRIAG